MQQLVVTEAVNLRLWCRCTL